MDHSISARLEKARNAVGLSVNALVQRLEGTRGASYGNVHRILKGHGEPTAQLVAAVGEALGVSVVWLLTGKGGMSGSSEAWDSRLAENALRVMSQFNREEDVAIVAKLPLGRASEASRRRKAVLRFARRLDDASTEGSLWEGGEARVRLLSAAGKFLRECEKCLAEAGQAYDCFGWGLMTPRAEWEGNYVQWSDSLLAVFSHRVVNLGSRPFTRRP